MPRVILTIAYSIKPEKREEYLQLAREMKDYFVNVKQKNYGVYEGKVKKNQFTEIFITESMEDYEALEDNQDETTQAMVSTLEKFLDGKGMKYRTLIESV